MCSNKRVCEIMNSSYEILLRDLKNIGIREGDVVVVHSSLKSMGYVEGGAECVIAALTDAIGKEGTLIFPTFTYRTSYADSFFSNRETPSCVGFISETFRKTEGVYRTNHPTHSVGIRGKLLDALIEGEETDDTPMGIHSPYRRLADVRAKILMLGCSLSHNSFMHALEEEAGLEYALRGHQEYTVIDAEGKRYTRRVRRHNFVREDGAVHQRYDRTLTVLDEGDYKIAKIHGAESVLIDSAALKEKALLKWKDDPLYFVDDPDGYYPNGCRSNL